MQWKPEPSRETQIYVFEDGTEFHVQNFNHPVVMSYFVSNNEVVSFPQEAHLQSHGETDASDFTKQQKGQLNTCCPLAVNTNYMLIYKNKPILLLGAPTKHVVKIL